MNIFSKKQILVTGAAGFIGHHLSLALKRRGDDVIGCDNFHPYYDPKLKQDRTSILQENGVLALPVDIREREALQNIIDDYGITHIVHLAAQAGVRYSLVNPQSYVDSNLEGFLSIMELCRANPGIKCVYASSSSVYGLNTKIPFSESDPTDLPTSLYGATKKSNELIAHAYHHLFKIPLTGLRFFTVYGPFGRPDMAYFSFTKAVLEENPILVFGEGKLLRDFTFIDDIVEGTIAAIDLGANYEIFNLGNHKPCSVLDLISCIEKETGKKAQMQFEPMQPGDVHTTYADISKSQKMLGFYPKTSLQEGIEKFVSWYTSYFFKR